MSEAIETGRPSRPTTRARLDKAVLQNKGLSIRGIEERLFTLLFDGLVYPQIWEDPETDLDALGLGRTSRLVAIASGGCNALSYLTADPAEVTAVDLNAHHVALVRLKLAALQNLPSYDSFYRFVGRADDRANIAAYNRFLRPHLDPETRSYWDGRDRFLRPRISLFAHNIYRHGVFGRFIGFCHLVCRLHGVDPRELINAGSLAEQRRFFEERMAPLFDRPFVKWALARSPALFGLGIPPAQYDALAAGGGIGPVLKARLERLTCGFALTQSYFTWQAFNRAYGGPDAPLPPFLQRRHYERVKLRAGRVKVVHRSVTEHLQGEPDGSVNGYVLLDAQDWMTDDQLNALWREITRTARADAKVVFRTAAEPSLLPGRVQPAILSRWTYEAARSRQLGESDRSATYGGFHLYTLKG